MHFRIPLTNYPSRRRRAWMIGLIAFAIFICLGAVQFWQSEHTVEGDVKSASDLPLFGRQLQELCPVGELSYGLRNSTRHRYNYVVSGTSESDIVRNFCMRHGIIYDERKSFAGTTRQSLEWTQLKNPKLVLSFPDGSLAGWGTDPTLGNIELYFNYSDHALTIRCWN
jgi:hypothetical protein